MKERVIFRTQGKQMQGFSQLQIQAFVLVMNLQVLLTLGNE